MRNPNQHRTMSCSGRATSGPPLKMSGLAVFTILPSMSSRSTDIVENLSRFIWGESTVGEFESWLYSEPALEVEIENEAQIH